MAIDLLIDLVKRRSVTPEDAGCQQLLADRLGAAGFDCESMPFGDVTNLWARHGDKEPVLCFAGHTDVVPTGDIDQWDSDPFEPELRDGNLYGRGTADMKSGLAAMIVAVEQFLTQNAVFDGSIAFLITSDEEGRARDGTLKVIEALQARGSVSGSFCRPSRGPTSTIVTCLGRFIILSLLIPRPWSPDHRPGHEHAILYHLGAR